MSDAQPITGLRPGQVAPLVFLCGDPARVARIAAHWERATRVAAVREFTVMTGECAGVAVSAASTGVGAPSAAVLLEELVKLGAHTFLRVGNSGGLHPALELGDLVVTTGAVRDDGTSRAYVAPEYPAVASHVLVGALLDAAAALGVRARAGVTWSLDAFYMRNAVLGAGGALESMSASPAWPRENAHKLRTLRDAGVLNMEMEAGVLLTLAGLFGVRAGAVCVVSDRAPWPGPAELDLDRNMERCIEVAQTAMLRVAKNDDGGDGDGVPIYRERGGDGGNRGGDGGDRRGDGDGGGGGGRHGDGDGARAKFLS